MTPELRQFIQQAHPVVRQRDLPRQRHLAAPVQECLTFFLSIAVIIYLWLQ